MTKKALNRVNLGLGIVRRLSQSAVVIGATALVGLVGQSDFEVETYQNLHSFEWFCKWELRWLVVIFVGLFLSKAVMILWKYIKRVNYFYELGKYYSTGIDAAENSDYMFEED